MTFMFAAHAFRILVLRTAGTRAPVAIESSLKPGSLLKMPALRVCLLVIMVLTVCFSAVATVRLPSLISDNMVLQEGRRVAIWGNADPGEHVTVIFSGQQTSSAADKDGHWTVHLGPFRAGGPTDMTITGKNTITLHDVAV